MTSHRSADPTEQIEVAVLTLLRRANDPRGNAQINRIAGVDVERSGSVLLARLEELQPVRLSQLASAAGIDISTASRQVARLVEQGYVDRTADPADGRATLHRLTESGAQVRRQLRRAVSAWMGEALSGLSEEERRVLGELMTRFVDGVTHQIETA